MKEKFTNTINIIKSSKRSRYMFIATIMLIFISVIGFSLSLFTNNNSKPIANIKVNGLSFNITTNTGESDDRILRLQAGKKESFYIKLKNLNNINVKYELKYSVCSDSNCTTSYSTLPNNVSVFVMPNSEEHINGEIATDESDIVEIELLTVNSNSEDVYIKLDLNAGYVWNDLALENQFEVISSEERNHNINIDILAYVDGILADDYPMSCNYVTEIKGYNSENIEISTSGSSVVCDRNTNTWKMIVDVLVKKVVINFTYKKGAPAFTFINKGTGENAKFRIENEDTADWKIYLLESGTLTFTDDKMPSIDVFLVGGGGGGGKGYDWYAEDPRLGTKHHARGGGGGGGGYTLTLTTPSINTGTEYSIVIGSGGTSGTAGGSTSAFSKTAAGGGAGGTANSSGVGSAGKGGSNGGNGGSLGEASTIAAGSDGTPGQGKTTREFGETTGKLYAGGGGGGTGYNGYGGPSTINAGGPGGGGKSSNNGEANTGGGGGGSADGKTNGASGGSGIVVIKAHN